MTKQYMLKMGVFYLSKYVLNPTKIESNFIDGLILTTEEATALKLEKDKAKLLNRSIYIISGLNFELIEVKENKGE